MENVNPQVILLLGPGGGSTHWPIPLSHCVRAFLGGLFPWHPQPAAACSKADSSGRKSLQTKKRRWNSWTSGQNVRRVKTGLLHGLQGTYSLHKLRNTVTQSHGRLQASEHGINHTSGTQPSFRGRADSDTVYLLFVVSLLNLSLLKHCIDMEHT